MSKFPKVNYIGNKEKIVDWIIENLPVKSGAVLDLFSGGNSVSYALKQNGYKVFCNDILYSSYAIGKALVENKNIKIDASVFDTEVKDDEIEKKYNEIKFLSNRIYFDNEVKELARLLSISEKIENEYEYYLFLALLRRAMIRKIPYSRMNIKWEEIKKFRDEEYSYQKYKRRRSYQNYAFEWHMRDNMDEYNAAVFDNSQENKCYNYDAYEMLEKLEQKVDVVYIDPPYPTTMNKYNDFYGLFDRAVGKEKQGTNFTDKKTFLDNMEKIIQLCAQKSRYVVISENNKSIPNETEITNMLLKYGDISVYRKSYQYRVTGKENKNQTIEILIVLKFAITTNNF